MNKNEAKNLKVKDVVANKVDGTKMVVSKIVETEPGKYKVTVYDVTSNKYKTFPHADLKVTGETGELPERKVSKVGRKPMKPMYSLETTDHKYSQEEYDKAGANAKRNVTAINTIVVQDTKAENKYLSYTVGSDKYYVIEANSLNNAKKIRNNIK